MQTFREYFQALAGVWKLERKISDGSRFSGTANIFLAAPDRFLVSEVGTLILPNDDKIEASRRWIWQYSDPQTLEVFYAETPPRLYHQIAFKEKRDHWSGSATHICGSDRYTGRYEFSAKTLVVEQKVRGPVKDYSLNSYYSAMIIGAPDR